MKDYYKILEIDRDATSEQISSAYRKKAIKYHPDHNKDPGAIEKFKEVAEAFEVLSNPDKKSQYDNPGHGFNFGNGAPVGSPFPDIFSHFFGGRNPKGFDIEQVLDLTFEEAALGCEEVITLKTEELCSSCKGQGVGSWTPCTSCGGTGRHVVRQSPFIMQTACPACKGGGKIPNAQCNSCSGKGHVGIKEENISIKIPAGIFSSARLRIVGKGGVNERGRGDLFVIINIKEHPFFNRDGCDIISEVNVPFSTMVLGGDVKVSTISGTATVKLSPGTKDGSKMRLAGLGMEDISNPSNIGDMYVILNVKVPDNPSDKYKKLIKQLSKLEVEYGTDTE